MKIAIHLDDSRTTEFYDAYRCDWAYRWFGPNWYSFICFGNSLSQLDELLQKQVSKNKYPLLEEREY